MRGWRLTGLTATLVIVLSFPLYMAKRWSEQGDDASGDDVVAPHFVGSASCRKCHQKEYGEWSGSHHQLAMAVADEKTVLGDFSDALFSHQGVTTKFYRRDGRFFVHTKGAAGEMAEFEISHTFGWFPLQQYLVPFPGGRLQCLPLAWDSREKRWFHLYGDEKIAADEWRYWTNQGQTWNGMCADCHSTGLEKKYDLQTDSYNTQFAEISVGCEACHGPGSDHLAWAQLPAAARSADGGLLGARGKMDSRQQAESCALCHSRRTVTGDFHFGRADLLDSLTPRLLSEGLYFPGGQILDEVYVYGSFVQSQMYQNGVKCSDCHNIHSLKPHKEGNGLCLQCHEARYYDTKEHHFHKLPGEKGEPIRSREGEVLFDVGTGANCVTCHMPARVYMGNDRRPDHSLRVPRPDLTASGAGPNSCNDCHSDKDAGWSAGFTKKWYGEKKRSHHGETFARARANEQGAGEELLAIYRDSQLPLIVRATALSLLGRYDGAGTAAAFSEALNSPDSLLRHSAILSLPQQMEPQRRVALLAPLLDDPVKVVRMEAARSLALLPDQVLPDQVKESRFGEVIAELRETLAYAGDFAEARLGLGVLASLQGDMNGAEGHLRQAVEIDPYLEAAYNNLAILYARQGKTARAKEVLAQGVAVNGDHFGLHYSLALLLAEEKEYPAAVASFKQAARGMADNGRLFYNLGQLQAFLQDGAGALVSLKRATAIEPENVQYLTSLLQFQLVNEDMATAVITAKKILRLAPDHQAARQVVRLSER
ncbi:MAG: tetratricopeptide repeat protein [Thermodesulfobacteriota bacterium]